MLNKSQLSADDFLCNICPVQRRGARARNLHAGKRKNAPKHLAQKLALSAKLIVCVLNILCLLSDIIIILFYRLTGP